jgi:hypothetical protein
LAAPALLSAIRNEAIRRRSRCASKARGKATVEPD